ncbi:MAG: hypothetical protein AB8B81_22170 [Halioglobus sp.]
MKYLLPTVITFITAHRAHLRLSIVGKYMGSSVFTRFVNTHCIHNNDKKDPLT